MFYVFSFEGAVGIRAARSAGTCKFVGYLSYLTASVTGFVTVVVVMVRGVCSCILALVTFVITSVRVFVLKSFSYRTAAGANRVFTADISVRLGIYFSYLTALIAAIVTVKGVSVLGSSRFSALVTVGITTVIVNVICRRSFIRAAFVVTGSIAVVVINVLSCNSCGKAYLAEFCAYADVFVTCRSDSSANVAVGITTVRISVKLAILGKLGRVYNSLESAGGIVALGITAIVKYVRRNSRIFANVTVGITVVGVGMYNAGILLITNVALGIAGTVVFMICVYVCAFIAN